MRILIIDDQTSMRFLISRKLQKFFEVEIEEASGVAHATTLLKEKKFDVIICDHWMDDGLGSEIAKFTLSQLSIAPPIIFFSSDQEVIHKHLRERSHIAILKPHLNELVDAISSLGFKKRQTGST